MLIKYLIPLSPRPLHPKEELHLDHFHADLISSTGTSGLSVLDESHLDSGYFWEW